MDTSKYEILKGLSPEQTRLMELQLKWFVYKWLDEKRKKSFVENLPKEDRDFLTQVIFCHK